jgi:hypothetical protein
MAEHTPTPWAISEVKTSCGRCFKIGSDEMLSEAGKPTYVCVYDDYGFGDNAQRANANFIVKAVNSHDALMKALEKVRSYNVDIAAGRINYRPGDHIAVIDEALAKVSP